MSRKTLAIILVVVGILGFLAALVMGIVGFPHAGFGTYKIGLAAIGAVVAAAGFIFLLAKPKAK